MRRQGLGRLGREVALLLAACTLLGSLITQAASDGNGATPAWATPLAKSVKLIGPATDIPNQPNFQSNLDCTELTYRQVSTNTMLAGCFVPTAYGQVDPDSGMAIFNGTDEALPLAPYSPHQVLTPWPGTVNTLTLDAANTGGSYLGMYKNLTAHLQNQRDLLARLYGKQITAPPDMTIVGPDGKQLVINPQTMAFSDGGSWLVVETMNGSFMRINLATLSMVAFAPAFGSQGSPALLKSQVAVSKNGQFVAIENVTAGSFKVYDLASCTAASTSSSPLHCATYDYWPFVATQIAGVSAFNHVRFINDGMLSFNATNFGGTNTYLLAPTASITSLLNYLALGDSYTSGEGAFDYLAGTDTGDDVCHLSIHSYPLLLARDVYGSGGGHSVACSGARTGDITPGQPDSYRGQIRGGVPRSQRPIDNQAQILADFKPGYLPQVDFVSHYQPAVLTVSVGGDDIGFGEIVQNCVQPHISLHLSDSVCYDTYEDRQELKALIDRTIPRWTAAYRQLQSRSPSSRVYIVGYPQIAVDNGDCALNVHLSKGELEFSEEVINYLNGAVQQAASQAKLTYVDISQALAGHRLCETAGYAVAVNGLTAGTDGGPFGTKVFGKESYHPNLLGQALIEETILQQTNNLRASSSATGLSNDSQKLLNKPVSRRAINAMVPEHGLVSSVVNRGESTILTVDGAADGLLPGSNYTVRIDGPSGPIIAVVGSGQTGSISEPISLPVNTVSGGHTINVIGPGQGNQPVNVTQPIYVPASSTDSDGDGISDTSDSCPGAINSGVDSDHDGIDDVCDPVIGSAPTSGTSGSGGSGTSTSSTPNSSSGPSTGLNTVTTVTVAGSSMTTSNNSGANTLNGTQSVSAAGKATQTTHQSAVLGASTIPQTKLQRPRWLAKRPMDTAGKTQQQIIDHDIWLGIRTSLSLLLLLILWLLVRQLRRNLDGRFRRRLLLNTTAWNRRSN